MFEAPPPASPLIGYRTFPHRTDQHDGRGRHGEDAEWCKLGGGRGPRQSERPGHVGGTRSPRRERPSHDVSVGIGLWWGGRRSIPTERWREYLRAISRTILAWYMLLYMPISWDGFGSQLIGIYGRDNRGSLRRTSVWLNMRIVLQLRDFIPSTPSNGFQGSRHRRPEVVDHEDSIS